MNNENLLPEKGFKALLRRRNAHSVLIRRAVLFAVSLFLIAVLVGSPVYHLLDRSATLRESKERVQTVLASASKNMADAYVPHDDYITGLSAWGVSSAAVVTGVGVDEMDDISAEDQERMLAAILEGDQIYVVKDMGHEYMRGITACETSNSVIVIDMDMSGMGGGRLASLLGLLAGFFAACAVGYPLGRRLLGRTLLQVRSLSVAANRVAEGNLDEHADETLPDELGELARSINNASDRLSASMYTMVVERNRLEHIINGLSEGIIAIDNQGHITHLNPAVLGMFEQKRTTVGLPDPRMKSIPDKSVWEDFDSVLSTGESVTRNFEYRDMTIRMIITPTMDELNEIAGAVGLFSDVTQMERLERTRREYVSNVSHELRTPLTAVRGLVEPLKDGLVTEEKDRMRYYDIILREVMRLSRLINDQLELSRLQSGSVAIEKARVAMDDLIYDVCDRYISIAQDKGLTLDVGDLSECPPVWANADRVEEMFIILLDNAIKYTEQGGVTVLADWDEEKVSISVKDTGIGIAAEDLPYVFDRFYKVDKAHSGKGSGLGLSILTELCKRMNETISVDSVKGEGSTFTFTVHRNPEPEDQTAEEAAEV